MRLSVCSILLAVLFSGLFSSAAGDNKAIESLIVKLKDDANWLGYYDGLHLIDDSLSLKHEKKLAAGERASNVAKREQRNGSIESTLVTAHFSSDCRISLRDIVKDAHTAGFLRAASAAAKTVGSKKLTQETLKISLDIFSNGRTAGQLQYHVQNAIRNCQP